MISRLFDYLMAIIEYPFAIIGNFQLKHLFTICGTVSNGGFQNYISRLLLLYVHASLFHIINSFLIIANFHYQYSETFNCICTVCYMLFICHRRRRPHLFRYSIPRNFACKTSLESLDITLTAITFVRVWLLKTFITGLVYEQTATGK